MELWLIMSIFALMKIYLIEFDQLIRIKLSCESLYQMNKMKMNLILKQQRYVIKIFKIRKGVLPKINQVYSSEKEAKITVDYGDK